MSASISFDRASEFYDATRGFPPGVGEQVAGSLASLIPPGSPVLEVGVGTGRVAIPLLISGYAVTGIDLSRNMLQKLREKLQDQSIPEASHPIDLVQGDTTCLPFLASRFEAVLAVHVLHLIPDWQAALLEIRRILAPYGSLFVGHTWRSDESPRQVLRRKHAEILQNYGFSSKRYVSRDMNEAGDRLKNMGAQETESVAAEWRVISSPSLDLEHLRQRIWSSTWNIPDDLYVRTMQELEAWASERYRSLDEPYAYTQRFLWRRYHW